MMYLQSLNFTCICTLICLYIYQDEVMSAISNIKSWTSPGIDDMPVEILKYFNFPSGFKLHWDPQLYKKDFFFFICFFIQKKIEKDAWVGFEPN